MNKYRPDIDGLRAIAIVIVVLFHYFPLSVPGGFIGVDIFFVISGFLITGILIGERKITLSTFYGHRIRRLTPALFVVLISTFVLGSLFLDNEAFMKLGDHLIAGATFTTNFLLLREEGYFDVTALHKPLMHLWSLGVEEQFYLVWPILLIVLMRLKRPRIRYVWITFLFAGSFAFNLYYSVTRPMWAFYMLPARFWELLVGCLLAIAIRTQPSKLNSKTANIGSALGLLALAFGLAMISERVHFPGYWALLPTLGSFLLLATGTHSWLGQNVLSSRAFVLIGKISYPLYLWHWVLLSFGLVIGERGIVQLPPVLLILVSGYLAYLTWKWVETPIRTRFSKPTSRDLRIGLSVACAVAVAILISGIEVENGKLRYPQLARAFVLTQGIDHPIDREERRTEICFLGAFADHVYFQDLCLKPRGRPHSHNLLIVGDSVAAHLYAGLKYLEDDLDTDVYQLNAGGCAPVFGTLDEGIRSKACIRVNDDVERRVAESPPQAVILFARWDQYLAQEHLLDSIEATVKKYHELGVSHVIVMGSPPFFSPSMPLLLEAQFIQKGLSVPERIKVGVHRPDPKVEDALDELAKRDDFVHVNLSTPPFCTSDGCLTRVGDNLGTDLTTYDAVHLSVNGAKFVSEKYLKPIIIKWRE